jgi:hypothetical protein
MEYRTVALLVAIVLAIAAWSAFMPKVTGFDDSWHCPNLGDGGAAVCIKKQQG